MTYKTYEDRVKEAADVIRTLTPEQAEAVCVLSRLVDTIGEYREKLSGYPESCPPNVNLTRDTNEYRYRIDLYVQFANALHEAKGK